MEKSCYYLLFFTVMALTGVAVNGVHHLNGTRLRRSGGYPKFPQDTAEDDSSAGECQIS